jgi:hypothetical protein
VSALCGSHALIATESCKPRQAVALRRAGGGSFGRDDARAGDRYGKRTPTGSAKALTTTTGRPEMKGRIAAPHDRVAVQARQPQTEENEIGAPLADQRKRLRAGIASIT